MRGRLLRVLAHHGAQIPIFRGPMRAALNAISPTLVEWVTPFRAIKDAFSLSAEAPVFPTRQLAWRHLFHEIIGRDQSVNVLEFGVFEGNSIIEFANLNKNPDSRFVGFDTFTGLPEDWVPGNPKGHFSTLGMIPEVTDQRISFVKGLFNDTVPPFLTTNQRLPTTTVIHFDADLYSSTLFVLAQLWAKYDEYYFIFDEFTGQEALALRDYLRAFGGVIEFYSQTHHVLRTPACLTGRVRNRNATVAMKAEV